jgi:hypothetical protein
MASTFESELIGDVDHTAEGFKTLLHNLGDVAKALPPSSIPSPLETPALVGALIAWFEHGDAVVTAAAKTAVHVAATVGRQNVADIETTIADGIKSDLARILAEAQAAGVDLSGLVAAKPADVASAAVATTPAVTQLTPEQLSALQALAAAQTPGQAGQALQAPPSDLPPASAAATVLPDADAAAAADLFPSTLPVGGGAAAAGGAQQ